MSSQNPVSLFTQYEQAIQNQSLTQFFSDLCNYSFEEVFALIKRSKKARNRKDNYCYQSVGADSFWKSNIPTHFFDDLLSTDNFLLEDMLLSYFGHQNNVNPDFVKLLANKQPEKLIRFAKLSQAFLGEEHWASFDFLRNLNNQSIHKFYVEAKYVKKLNDKFEETSQEFHSIIYQINYEDLTFYVTKLITIKPDKASSPYILNEILTIKRNYHTSHNYSNQPYDNIFDLVKRGKEIDSCDLLKKLKNRLLGMIDFFEKKYLFRQLINNYYCGYADFKWANDFEFAKDLFTNRFFARYERNKKKGIMMKWLFMNKALIHLNQINIAPNAEKDTLYKKQIYLEYFKYLNLDLIFEWYSEKLDLKIIFDLLISFSNYGSDKFIYETEKRRELSNIDIPLPNNTSRKLTSQEIEAIAKIMMKPVNDFQSQIGEGGDIIIFDQEKFIKFCENQYGKGRNYDKYLEFLTCELTSTRAFEVDTSNRPFLKIGKFYLFCGKILKTLDWSLELHKRLKKEKKDDHETQSKKTEQYLGDLLRKKGIQSVLNSYKYKLIGLEGDIDWAWFDAQTKTLMIAEIKMTTQKYDIIDNEEYNEVKYQGLAAYQLEKAIEYIERDFEDFKSKIGIDQNLEFKDIEIKTLIISNTFWNDDTRAKGKHLKISLFELIVILENDLYNMLNADLSAMKKFQFGVNEPSQIAPTFSLFEKMKGKAQGLPDWLKVIDCSKTNTDLWQGEHIPTIKSVWEAISKDKIWEITSTPINFEPVNLKNFEL